MRQVRQVQCGAQVRQVRQVRWVLLMILLLPPSSWAQGGAQNVEVDPVTCWWRTGASAVRVGEPFSLFLTCSILETDAARAIVDRGRLGTAAVQFPPYEVIGGSQSADEVTPGRRFIQYEYSLRLINEDAFGRDVAIPEMQITYRIESQVQQDASVQGREQNYVLPALPMRIQSLVPTDATHIREPSVPTLGEIATREFRGRMLRLIGGILFAIAGLVVLLALARSFRRRRGDQRVGERRRLSDAVIVAAVRRELKALQHETRGGWTPELAGRALSALRIVASYAAGRPVPQRPATKDAAADGELLLRSGWLSSSPIVVSGGATSSEVDSELASALSRLTTARYGRLGKLDDGELNDALDAGIRAANRLGSQHTWLARSQRSLGRSLLGWRQRVWAR